MLLEHKAGHHLVREAFVSYDTLSSEACEVHVLQTEC